MTDYNGGTIMEITCLTHHFLIAMPAMADPNFSRTLTYICEHNTEGALGLVVNRPLDMSFAELARRVNIPLADGVPQQRLAMLPVHSGGPVQTDHGFILHRPVGHWQSSLRVTDEIALTSSRDILRAMSERAEPEDVLICLGYAGWTAGQLEWELAQNAWLTVEANADILFRLPPEERLPGALQQLGIDFANLSGVAGHA